VLVIAPENLPRLNAVRIDLQVLGFSILAGLLSAVIFGVIPAIRTAKPNLMDILRTSGEAVHSVPQGCVTLCSRGSGACICTPIGSG